MNSSRRTSRVVLLLALIGVIVEGGFILKLWQDNQSLRESNEKARRSGKPDLARQLAKRDAELQVLRVQVQDLLKLRHEARLLRAATNDLARLQEENRRLKQEGTNTMAASAPATIVVTTGDGEDFVAKEGWTFSGYATPEATLQSWLWSLREGDLDAFLETLTADDRARFEAQLQQSNKTEEELAADLKRQAENLTGFQILDQNSEADGSIVILARVSGGEPTGATPTRHRFIFTRSGTEWKMTDAGVDQ